ncbi:MAG: hydrogenase 3 maturation endopeptidase HyCI [Candidatus Hodarchaeales archaeon]|jgi:hydrogenase 3 maturation protease
MAQEHHSAKEELTAFINSSKTDESGNLAFFCVGNDLKGDDGVGVLLANELKKRIGNKVIILDVGSVPQNFLSLISKENISHCLLIDAVEFDAEAGTVGFFDPSDLQEYQVTFSTHFIPMKVFIDYWVEETGAIFRVLGVQPKTLDFGAPLSTEVAKAAENIADLLSSLI